MVFGWFVSTGIDGIWVVRINWHRWHLSDSYQLAQMVFGDVLGNSYQVCIGVFCGVRINWHGYVLDGSYQVFGWRVLTCV